MFVDFRSKILDYKNSLIISKKYLILYILFISVTCLSTISKDNLIHPKFELLTFILVAILGIFGIVYYFQHNYNKLHKTAFIIILCFGICSALIVPICDVSDEPEHLIRSEITSRGILIPHWNGVDKGLSTSVYIENNGQKHFYPNVGYETIETIYFFQGNTELTIFETKDDTKKINITPIITESAFEQNPFYGYLPQAVGIAIAKFFDLNAIWMLWLGRICNLIVYAGLISFAIKKTPCLKIPLLIVSCIPISIYQAASVSIDSLLFALGILVISYFIYMCKTENLETRDIIIFTSISLLMGLCKLPYLSFVFLLLFIPIKNFKENNKIFIYLILSIIFVSVIGLLWSSYSSPTLLHSWRPLERDFNSTMQINFLINNPNMILTFVHQIFNSDLLFILNGFFNFFNGTPGVHYADTYYFITIILQLFLTFTLLTYPSNVKFNLKTRLGSFGIILLVYIGTCFIQLLTWANVGETSLGVSIRYFIPLLALFPVISPLKLDVDIEKFDNVTMVLIIGFMATLILAFATKYY